MQRSMSKVNPGKGVSGMTLSIADLAKNVDLDGDGDIEPEEKEILDTLKSMDVDGDGTISLKELVNLGGKMNEAKKNAQFYKRLIWGVLLLCLVALCGVFVACLAAVEASKDSKPSSDGTLKTTVVGGDAKVVATGVHKESITLLELNDASFSTLRGISDLGFKVGSKFYQYTITGFEQDFTKAGDSMVRLFTSRGDSIYITKSLANLEKASGTVVDIKKAVVQGRRRLLQDLAADLIGEDVLNAAGGTAESTSGFGVEKLTTEQKTALADTANDVAAADVNGTGAQTQTDLAYNAYMNQCPEGMEQKGTPEAPKCVCEKGFSGATAMYSAATNYTWAMVGNCTVVDPPVALNVEYQHDDTSVFHAACGYGYVGTINWNFESAEWTGACTKAPAPKGVVFEVWKDKYTYGKITEYMNYVWASCDIGTTADPADPIFYDMVAAKWKGKCVVAPCPEGSMLTFDVTGKVEMCDCKKTHFGLGYKWSTWDVNWNQTADNFCHPKMEGLLYNCSMAFPKYGMWSCPSMPAEQTVEHTELKSPIMEGMPPVDIQVGCKKGFKGKVAWDFESDEWKGNCTEVLCPEMAYKVMMFGEPMCKCMPSFRMESGTGVYDEAMEMFQGECKFVECPPHSARELGSLNGSFYLGPVPGHCHCKPGFEGRGFHYNGNTSMFDPMPAMAGAKAGCSKMTCPAGMQDHSEPGEDANCGCPDGYHETPGIEGGFGMGYINGSWAYVGTCTKIPCPDNTTEVVYAGDVNHYCACPAGKLGEVNWYYPAQQEYMQGILSEQDARKKVEMEGQRQNFFANCSAIPCPYNTERINGKCMCAAGSTGTVMLAPSGSEYYDTCMIAYQEYMAYTPAMEAAAPYPQPKPVATCAEGYKPFTKNNPFGWDYTKQKYMEKDQTTGAILSSEPICEAVPCPAGTYEGDLTFQAMTYGTHKVCKCLQNGNQMTDSGMSKIAAWDFTTKNYKLTKADCFVL